MTSFKIIFAFFYDFMLLFAVWFAAAIPFVLWQGEGFDEDPMALFGFQAYLLAVTYLYLSYFWVLNGQSPGLRVWHLRIQREDGYLMTRYNANLRFVLGVVLFPIGWIGLFATAKKQTFQDQLAGTQIISIKQPKTET